jgi:hypothetical protein
MVEALFLLIAKACILFVLALPILVLASIAVGTLIILFIAARDMRRCP